MKSSHFSKDALEFFHLLSKYEVNYLIVGGEAVIYYGHARLTGDVDIYFEMMSENVEKLYQALTEFWEGQIPGLKKYEELMEPGVIIQFGVPPNRIDLINQIEAVVFKDAWANKVTETIISEERTIPIHFIGILDLIMNKASLDRPKDMDDLIYLRKRVEANL
jgi:hypothetical protein